MLPLIGAALSPLVKSLFENGLTLLGNAVLAKGKDAVEQALDVKLPDNDKTLTAEQVAQYRELESARKERLIELGIRQEEVAQGAVTKRWEADMLSDSWLSKNIRPLALAHTLLVFDMLIVFALFGKVVPTEYLTLIGQLLALMVSAYFVGRSVEKGLDLYQGWKQTQGH